MDKEAKKPRRCVGVLYFSSSRFDSEKRPLCAGLGKRGKEDGRGANLPTDSIPGGGGEFKYACVGYSAYDEQALKNAARRRQNPTDAIPLPYCEGLEIVSSEAINRTPAELLAADGPGVTRQRSSAPSRPDSNDGGGGTGQRPGRTFVPGLGGRPQMPTEVDLTQFKERFDRISKKIVDKMAQNATFMGATIKKSLEAVLKDVTGGGGGGRDRP